MLEHRFCVVNAAEAKLERNYQAEYEITSNNSIIERHHDKFSKFSVFSDCSKSNPNSTEAKDKNFKNLGFIPTDEKRKSLKICSNSKFSTKNYGSFQVNS